MYIYTKHVLQQTLKGAVRDVVNNQCCFFSSRARVYRYSYVAHASRIKFSIPLLHLNSSATITFNLVLSSQLRKGSPILPPFFLLLLLGFCRNSQGTKTNNSRDTITLWLVTDTGTFHPDIDITYESVLCR